MKNKKEILNLMQSDEPVLLHFYKSGCPHNKELSTTLKRLKKSNVASSFNVLSIEVKKQPQLVSELEVEGAPTVVLYCQGEEKWRAYGYRLNDSQILKAIWKLNQNVPINSSK